MTKKKKPGRKDMNLVTFSISITKPQQKFLKRNTKAGESLSRTIRKILDEQILFEASEPDRPLDDQEAMYYGE